MDQPDEPLQYVAIVCPTCGTRMTPEVGENERTITCPDCFVNVTVPSRGQAEARRARERPRGKPHEADPYELSARPPVREVSAAQATVTCPSCGVRLTPFLEARERTMLCPECYEEIRIPARKDAASAPRKKKRQRDEAPLDEFEDWKESIPRRRTLADLQAEIREEPIPDPPRWTFFSRVFDFPWQGSALSRWAWMSLAWLATGVLVVFMHSLAVEAFAQGDNAKVITLAFFALPAIWIGIWTLSYSAACCVPVIMDTGNGNDRVSAWPEPNWREWALQLLHVGFVALAVQVLAIAIGRGTEGLFGSVWPGALATLFLLYPIALLSSLETDSPWTPVSGPILKSLVTHWWAWLAYYPLAGGLAAAWLGLFVLGVRWAPYLTVIVAAPLLAAVLLIESRLLGRLAWRASLVEEEEGKAGDELSSEDVGKRRLRRDERAVEPW